MPEARTTIDFLLHDIIVLGVAMLYCMTSVFYFKKTEYLIVVSHIRLYSQFVRTNLLSERQVIRMNRQRNKNNKKKNLRKQFKKNTIKKPTDKRRK